MSDADRTMTASWTDPRVALPELARLSGIDYLRRVQDGELPPPPISQVVGMRFVEIEVGRFSVAAPASEAFFNPLGSVHGGLVCTLLDTALACAAHTTLPAGSGYTSIDLAVRYLRPVLPSAVELIATGRVVKPGRRVVFAEGELRDAAGTLLASATSSLLVLQPAAGPQ